MITTKIQWTEKTHNFWMGCKKVSEGCKFCYMYRMRQNDNRNGAIIWRVSDQTFYNPMDYEAPKVIFTCSMSDFFIEEADGWREDAWNVIRATPQHKWQILTKRPERIKQCLPSDWGEGWKNVWLGVTIEKQEYMNRAQVLSEIPAYVRFISAEPLLEEIDFLEEIDGKRPIDSIQWVILGGESGYESGRYTYRVTEIEWFERAIHDLKTNSKATVFVKQLGSHWQKVMKLKGKYGGDVNEFPGNLQIREFPESDISFKLL